MFYVANSILKDEHLAEDAVHQAFIKIIENLNKINEILDNSDKRAYLTKQCGIYYEKSNWEAVAQRTKDLYYEMLDTN